MTRNRILPLVLVLPLIILPGGANLAAQQAPLPPSKFKLTSPAFTEGATIPPQFTCADPNPISPPLAWTNPPAAAESFAVILHDVDAAPDKGVMDGTRWIFWGIPAVTTLIAAGVKPDTSPNGIVQGQSIRGVNGYQRPCPPPNGTPHHFLFEIYALDTKLDLPAGSSRADLLKAMDGHVVGKASYVGMFGY